MPLLIALVLVGHAVMHIGAVACGLLFVPTPPWIVTGTGVDFDAVKAIAVVLTSITVAGYLFAVLAGAGIVVPRSWWRPLVVVASVASATMLVGLFSLSAVPGLAIDAVLVWAVLARSWQPTPILGSRASRTLGALEAAQVYARGGSK
jgi:hypothetical protein